MHQLVLQFCLQYCEDVGVADTGAWQPATIIRFLAELCLRKNPTSIGDSSTSVLLSADEKFVLDFTDIAKRGEGPFPGTRRQTPRRSHRLKSKEVVCGRKVLGVLMEWLGKGLSFLRGKQDFGSRKETVLSAGCGDEGEISEEREEVLEQLWCAMVCTEHVR